MKSFVIICLCIIIYFIFWKGVQNEIKKENIAAVIEQNTPPGATNIVNIGNNWVTFDLQERHYLFHHNIHSESLTELSK